MPNDTRELAPWLRRMLDFVLAETVLTTLPHVPGITLLLARESVPLWSKIEDELGPRPGPPYWAFAWVGGLALARHLTDHPDMVAGRHVLDFTSGSASSPSRRRRAVPRMCSPPTPIRWRWSRSPSMPMPKR